MYADIWAVMYSVRTVCQPTAGSSPWHRTHSFEDIHTPAVWPGNYTDVSITESLGNIDLVSLLLACNNFSQTFIYTGNVIETWVLLSRKTHFWQTRKITAICFRWTHYAFFSVLKISLKLPYYTKFTVLSNNSLSMNSQK